MVVGSVGHVLKRAFQDLFAPPARKASVASQSGAEAAAKEYEEKLSHETADSGPSTLAADADAPDPRAASRLALVRSPSFLLPV